MTKEKKKGAGIQEIMPSAEEVQKELAKAKSMDDFFGKEGIFARLFADTIETMLDAELGTDPQPVGHLLRRLDAHLMFSFTHYS